MSARMATWLAWVMWAACAALLGATLVLSVLSRNADTPLDEGWIGFLFAFPMLSFPTVGAVVVSRHPAHPIGWLFLGVGLLFAIGGIAPAYVEYDRYVNPGALPVPEVLVWPISWVDSMMFLSVAFLMLVFPTGSLPSRRWRPVLWFAIGVSALSFVTSAFRPGLIWPDTLRVENPLGIAAAGDVFDRIDDVVWLSFAATIVLACASVIVRFRGSRGDERQQMKWMALAALFVAFAFVVANTTSLLGEIGEAIVTGLIAAALAAIPVTVGLAILRYRLYEIDRVISRTLVYGLLTVILGASYVGLVLVGQWVTSSFAGGSDLAIAVSTLVVAALFLPARARVQRLVDRRFYRRRYDAQRTLEAFGARLRDEVELEALGAELRRAVGETMQPAHVSVWLREAAR